MSHNIYAESTPNPNVMKFVSNKMITKTSVEFTNAEEADQSNLAKALFNLPFVKSIFISDNFISVTKNDAVNWNDIAMQLRVFIGDLLNNTIAKNTKSKTDSVNQDLVESPKTTNKKLSKAEKNIIAVLDQYIKPAILSDGGAIEFNAFEDGIVKVILKGACSGCPSSTATLKQGIETLLKQKIGEEIKEVVAVNG